MLNSVKLIFLIICLFSHSSQAQKNEQVRHPAQLSDGECNQAPQIAKALVFQSVEAPQIDMPVGDMNAGVPIDQYDQYDLVKGKTAVVLVDIYNNQKTSLNNKKFSLSLNIKRYSTGKITDITFSECLKFVTAVRGRDNHHSSNFCSFTSHDVAHMQIFQKVLLLPKNMEASSDFIASVQLSHKGKTCSKKTFSFNVHSTRPLSIAFSGLDGKHCQTDLITNWNKMKTLKDSDEVQKYIPALYSCS